MWHQTSSDVHSFSTGQLINTCVPSWGAWYPWLNFNIKSPSSCIDKFDSQNWVVCRCEGHCLFEHEWIAPRLNLLFGADLYCFSFLDIIRHNTCRVDISSWIFVLGYTALWFDSSWQKPVITDNIIMCLDFARVLIVH